MEMFVFKIMYLVVGVFVAVGFVYTIAMTFNPKLRGKMMSKNIKAMKHMTDISRDDLEDIYTQFGEMGVNVKGNIINNNEETLRNIANKEANINKEAVKTTFGAIKEGLSGNNENMFCKHCGAMIDSDSKFCKSCGKEQ